MTSMANRTSTVYLWLMAKCTVEQIYGPPTEIFVAGRRCKKAAFSFTFSITLKEMGVLK